MHRSLSPTDSNGRDEPSAEALLWAIVESSEDAIISENLNGIITGWNNSAARIFGYHCAEAIGSSIGILLPADRVSQEEGNWQRVRGGERVKHFDTVRRRKDGRVFDVSLTLTQIRGADGQIVGVLHTIRDVMAQKHGIQAGLLLAAIVNSSEDAIVSKDLQGVITSWNQGAERIFGYTPEEAIGQSVLMLVPAGRKDEEPKILERLRHGERVDHFETIRVRKNGEHFPVSLTISPIRDLAGTIVGASKIARDITNLKSIEAEREQLLESERAARSQAEQANRMKDDFLSTISHELRTPLNCIVAWTQLLKENGLPTEELSEGIEAIERSTLAQAQLIDDLLDLGRVASGKMTLQVDRLEIGAIVQEAISAVQHAATAKQIQIKQIISPPFGGMIGDKQRLQQVVWNLLSNAIKFTPQNGTVTATVSQVASRVEISISDNGCGIDPDFLPHVFERFRQADSSTTRKFGGLGIGLAIVKELVDLHGGQVRAESPGLGQGATFTVSLPVLAGRLVAQKNQIAAEEEFMRSREDLKGIRVLVVDDDGDFLDVIRRILSSRNAEVVTAHSAQQALELLSSFTPDVILSDIGMPGQDGYEFIRSVRKLGCGRAIPAAALTALVRPEDRTRALRAGFQTQVAKPISPAELVATVSSLSALQRGPIKAS